MRRRLSQKQITLVVVIAALICIAAAVLLLRSFETYRFQEDAALPLDGELYQIPRGKKAVLKRGERYATIRVDGENELTGEDNAAYFRDRDGILLLSGWEYVPMPEGGELSFFSLPCFTELQSSGRSYIVSKNGANAITEAAFLYNGKDSYIFLRDTVLTYGDRKVKLPALSFVQARFGSWVQYYDPATGEFIADSVGESDRITVGFTDVDIRVMVDSDLIRHGQKEYMLLSEVTYLKDYLQK